MNLAPLTWYPLTLKVVLFHSYKYQMVQMNEGNSKCSWEYKVDINVITPNFACLWKCLTNYKDNKANYHKILVI